MPWLHDITLDSRAAVLCLLPPDWRAAPKTRLGFDTEIAEGLSGIEARASNHHHLRLTEVEFSFRLKLADAEEFRTDIKALGTKLLALPLWPDLKAKASHDVNRAFVAQHHVTLTPATGAYTVDGDSGETHKVGLFAGRLVDQPRITARTDQEGIVTVRIREDSPYAARVGINPSTMDDWALKPNWASAPEESTRTELTTSRLGRGREQAVDREYSPSKVTQKGQLTLTDRVRIRRLLTFFNAKRGSWAEFTMPRWFRPGSGTGVTPYLTMKFAQDDIELEWITTDAISCDLLFEEVLELDPGEPAQALASIAHLYKLWWDGSATVFAWTDWEDTLTHDSTAYTPAKIEHRAPTENLRPGTSEWEVMVHDFTGNPLRAFTLLQLERRLHIEIRECDPTDVAATAILRFKGEVNNAPCRGRLYTASCTLLGGALARLVPNFYVQRSCNHVLGDALCGIDLDLHKVTTTVSAIDGVEIDLASGGAEDADWFAGGYIEVGSGDDLELRFVLRSESLGAGVRLTLNRPLRINTVAAAVNLYPGCDGEYDGGCAAFDNQDEFGGFPHMPQFFESVDSGFKAQTGK